MSKTKKSDKNGNEVSIKKAQDFVIESELGKRHAMQVCSFLLTNPEVRGANTLNNCSKIKWSNGFSAGFWAEIERNITTPGGGVFT